MEVGHKLWELGVLELTDVSRKGIEVLVGQECNTSREKLELKSHLYARLKESVFNRERILASRKCSEGLEWLKTGYHQPRAYQVRLKGTTHLKFFQEMES